MVDLRTLLAGVLGLLVGAICLFAPETVVRTQALGRGPPGRSGEYGSDASLPDRWRRLVQALGVGCVLASLYFGYVALG